MDLWESMITQVFPQLVCNRYYLNLNMYELPIYKIEQMHLLQITKEWNFFFKKKKHWFHLPIKLPFNLWSQATSIVETVDRTWMGDYRGFWPREVG